jgi:hypothetical protein
MNDNYISRQITVYQTSKKLVEFNDKLKTASVENYAHLHADSEKGVDGRRRISCIGVKMLDYSGGTGDKTISVEANLSPDNLLFLFEQVRANVPGFEFTEDKIFGVADSSGRMTVTKFRLVHSDPKVRKLPWGIEIGNGTGIAAKNAAGGTYCKSGSYAEKAKVFLSLSDMDAFKLFSRTARYIQAWEAAVCPRLVSSGHKAIEANQQQNAQ